MPNLRSKTKLAIIQRRYINRVVSQQSHIDKSKKETINTLTPRQIEYHIEKKFGTIVTPFHLQYERGEVLADPYGRGTHQRFTHLIDEEDEETPNRR